MFFLVFLMGAHMCIIDFLKDVPILDQSDVSQVFEVVDIFT